MTPISKHSFCAVLQKHLYTIKLIVMKKLNVYVNTMFMIFSLSLLLSCSTVMAQQQDSISANQFVQEAANSGRKEVKMGEMGRQKAQNAKVKDYAAMIVTDHAAANAELKTLATSKNISLPDSIMPLIPKTGDSTMRDTTMRNTGHHHDMLMQASGADFDAQYIQMMVDDHDKAIALFEKGAKVTDPDIKAFAAKHLPTLRRHLNEAVKLSKDYGNPKNKKQQGTGQ